LSGTNTFDGGVTLSQGQITIGNSLGLGQGSLVMNSGTTLGLASGINPTNSISLTGTAAVNVSSGSAILSGVISGISGSLTKTGSGTVTLVGINTYAGGTTINGGTLALSTTGVLSATGSLAVNGTSKFDISAITPSIITTGDLTTASGTSVNLGGKILTFGTTNDTTLAGIITGTGGSIIKQGTGTVTFSGINTYTGGTRISGGKVKIASAANLGGSNANVTIDNNATLDVTNSGSLGLNLTISTGGTGTLQVDQNVTLLNSIINPAGSVFAITGTGSLTLSDSNNYAGETFVNTLLKAGSSSAFSPNSLFVLGPFGQVDLNGFNSVINNLSGTGYVDLGGNTLTINGTGDETYGGVISGTGSIVVNGSGTLVLTGTNTYSGGTVVSGGTFALSGSGSLLNTGAVTLYSPSVFDISAISGSEITIGDLSTDPGTTVALGSKRLRFGMGNNTTVAGIIIGGGGSIVKQGSGTVTFSGINTYSGGTTISLGALIGNTESLQGDIVNNATLQFNQTTSGTYSGFISGNGTNDLLITSGQTLSFTGNSDSFSGTTSVSGGRFNLNGTLGGISTIESTGVLSGAGTLQTVINGGIIEPGNSIGTINITGDYTQGADGIYNVEINSAGGTDLINVTGTAYLDGTVSVSPESGIYSQGTTYKILTANAINGTFSSIIQPPAFGYKLLYTPQFVSLQIDQSGYILPVPNSALTGNARAVADYLFCGTFDAENPDLFSIEESLIALAPTEYTAALQQLAPTQYSALPLLELENNARIIDTYTARIKRLAEFSIEQKSCYQDGELWADAMAFFYRQDALSEQIGFDAETYGVSFGGGKGFRRSVALGFAGSYSYSHLKWDNGQGSSNSNALYMGPFLSWHQEVFYLETAMLGAVNFYSNERTIAFPGVYREADNNHLDWNITNSVDLGSKIYVFQTPWFFEPFLQVFFVQSFQNSFSETGSGSLDLYVNRNFASFIRGNFEMNFGVDLYKKQGIIVTTELMLGFMDTRQLTSANYTTNMIGVSVCASNFTVSGYDTSPMQLHYGASITHP
jgi:autotransporter-associated beta strand protein